MNENTITPPSTLYYQNWKMVTVSAGEDAVKQELSYMESEIDITFLKNLK